MPTSPSSFAILSRVASSGRQRAGSLITLPKSLRFSTSSKFANLPQSKDDLALPKGMHGAAAEMRSSFSSIAAPLKPFKKEQLTMKDGTRVTVSSVDPLASAQDEKDLSAFYYSLSSFSGIKGDRCSDRRPMGSSDIAHHAPRQLEIARECVRDGGRVLVVRADVDGKSRIIGACMYERFDDTASPHRMVTADAYTGKGVASMLKLAQIECAQADGLRTMRNYHSPEPQVVRAYEKACTQLGLRLDLSGRGVEIDLWPGSALQAEQNEMPA